MKLVGNYCLNLEDFKGDQEGRGRRENETEKFLVGQESPPRVAMKALRAATSWPIPSRRSSYLAGKCVKSRAATFFLVTPSTKNLIFIVVLANGPKFHKMLGE